MDLKGIMLSEISLTEKDKYHIISLNAEFKKQSLNRNRFINTGNKLVVVKGKKNGVKGEIGEGD